jgi:hypothetical protein
MEPPITTVYLRYYVPKVDFFMRQRNNNNFYAVFYLTDVKKLC